MLSHSLLKQRLRIDMTDLESDTNCVIVSRDIADALRRIQRYYNLRSAHEDELETLDDVIRMLIEEYEHDPIRDMEGTG